MNQSLLLTASLSAIAALATVVTGHDRERPPASVEARATAIDVRDAGTKMTMRPADDEAEAVIIEATNEHGELMRIRADSIRLSDGDGEAQRDMFISSEGQVVLRWIEQAPPPVRIGVLTEPVPDALASHLKVEPASALVIVQVVDGMPAARAGLQMHDVVVRVDASTPVTSDRLRAVLATKQPGESIALDVIRAGTPMTIDVVPQVWEEVEVDADRSTLQVPVMGSIEIDGVEESGSVFLVETPVFIDATLREQAARGVPMMTDAQFVATGPAPTHASYFTYRRPGAAMAARIVDGAPVSAHAALLREIEMLRAQLHRLESIAARLAADDARPAAVAPDRFEPDDE